ncbi:electron carrier/ protein disulfide oxidoreductase [Anaeramoeba flamelloides]|uniref:Electron carrier/ protein disulfide oxidoreductase n=1 Tax=Anaeramoeba flamelloides TaxID=1746091 RepID=A0ABQ8XSK0_9EUKA|nr:electron carrier/ protein disulfide oxidoreductase [Anaeramoeba flamelloides]
MGNQIDLNQSKQLTIKLFKKQIHKKVTTKKAYFYCDEFGRATEINTAACSILKLNHKNFVGFSVLDHCPKDQAHLGVSTEEYFFSLFQRSIKRDKQQTPKKNQSKKQPENRQTQQKKRVRIILSFLNRLCSSILQSNTFQIQKKEKFDVVENRTFSFLLSEEESKTKNGNDPKDHISKDKQKNVQKKQGFNLIWVELQVQPFSVEGIFYFEVKVRKIEKPSELISKRAKIEEFKKEISKLQKESKTRQKETQRNPLTNEITQINEEIKYKVKAVNENLERNKQKKEEISEIEKEISARNQIVNDPNLETDSAIYQIGRKTIDVIISDLTFQQKKLFFQIRKLRGLRMSQTFDLKIRTTQLRIEQQYKEKSKINSDYERLDKKINDLEIGLKKIKNSRTIYYLKQPRFVEQEKVKKSINETLEIRKRQADYCLKKIQSSVTLSSVEDEILALQKKLRSIIKKNNGMKSKIKKLQPHPSHKTINKHKHSRNPGRRHGHRHRHSHSYNLLNKKLIGQKSLKRFKSFSIDKDIIFENFKNHLSSSGKVNSQNTNSDTKKDLNTKLNFDQNIDVPFTTESSQLSNNALLPKISKFSEFIQVPIAIDYFKTFLVGIYKQDYLYMLLELKELKKYYTNENAEEICDDFIKKFFLETAPFYIDIPKNIIEDILNEWEVSEYSLTLFDKAEKYIEDLFVEKYFPAFQSTIYYQELQKVKNYDETNNDQYKEGVFISEKKQIGILNGKYFFKGNPRSPNLLLENLLSSLIELLTENFSYSLGIINCEQLSLSEAYKKFQVSSSELQKIRLERLKTLNGPEKTSFFLNLYHTICIHSLIENKIPNSPNSLNRFFKQSKYNLGSFFISLSDIVYRIFHLRKSKKKSTKKKRALLKPLAIDIQDIRINFALISATEQTCHLQVYTPEKLDSQLNYATKHFLTKNITIDTEKKIILLPYIFDQNNFRFFKKKSEIIYLIRNFFDFLDPISLYFYSIKFVKRKIKPIIEFG